MYSLSKTIMGPSGIDHCVEAVFTSPNDINLVIVKSNSLEIYKVTEYTLSGQKVFQFL